MEAEKIVGEKEALRRYFSVRLFQQILGVERAFQVSVVTLN
jgi:hypothetical protein